MKKSETNLVYIIQMGASKYYKIGISNNVNRRLKDLQTGNPLPLHIVATISLEMEQNADNQHFTKLLEKELHLAFQYCRQVGEWFKFENDEQEILKKWAEKNVITDFENYINLIKVIHLIQDTKTNFEEDF